MMTTSELNIKTDDAGKRGFIKSPHLLDENSREIDLLNFDAKITLISKRMDSINNATIIALVGPFGSGKSTALNLLKISRSNSERWIEFDAWKYPEKMDLWEGLVLDFAEQIGEKKAALGKIRGKNTKIKWLDFASEIVGSITEHLPETADRVPDLGFITKFTEFFKKSPATRTFELQEIFKILIAKTDKPICIIIEDIDRSGDAGIYFLETLNQFLKTAEFKKKITCIVPIANENFHNHLQSYLKCIDYFEFFNFGKATLTKFVDELFDESLFEGQLNNRNNSLAWTGINRKSQITSFMEGLFIEMPNMTIRLLKLILRKANINYINQTQDGHDPDFRVVICFEAAKYFRVKEESRVTFFDDFATRRSVLTGNIFSAFLFSMLRNANSVYQTKHLADSETVAELQHSSKNFRLTERLNNDKRAYPSYPYVSGFPEVDAYNVADFYIRY